MITVQTTPVRWQNGRFTPSAAPQGREGTMAHAILMAHNTSDRPDRLSIRFDAMASHDITYVGIIQTARASGMEEFPLPYVLTNCHNSLCAVGGTINEDDHVFGLSAAKKYGGEFVPAHQAVIHSYMRERYAAPGRMILGSDSHTRYGAYGCMAIGEGGPELARQLLRKTYDIAYPNIIAVYLTGAPRPGVGPQDVALALVGATFKAGAVKNAVLEFFGPGVASLSMDYRSGIDVMTTETTCLSSVWQTDAHTKTALALLGRGDSYREMAPAEGAYYDGVVTVELDKVEPMIALPFHPSNAYTIREFKANMADLLHQVDVDAAEQLGVKNAPSLVKKIVGGQFLVDQGVIAGCSGGAYQNLKRAAEILTGCSTGSGAFWLSCYPGSMPINLELTKNGYIAQLMAAGASILCSQYLGGGDRPSAPASAGPASARGMCPPTGHSPSATPPATSPTGRAPSPETARSPTWPSWTPGPSPPPPGWAACSPGRTSCLTCPQTGPMSSGATTIPHTNPGSTSASGSPSTRPGWCSAPTSPTGRSRSPCRKTCCSPAAPPSTTR